MLAVVAENWQRLARDRTGLFFLFLLPLLVIGLIGFSIRNTSDFRIGLVVEGHGPVTDDLVATLRSASALDVTDSSSEAAARTSLRRNELDAVVVIPADLDARVHAGATATVDVVAEQSSSAQLGAFTAVSTVVQRHGNQVMAARFAADEAGGSIADRLHLVRKVEPTATPVSVGADAVNSGKPPPASGFNYSAPTMLVLFVFINSMAAGGSMIATRDLGIYDRALAGPVKAGTLVGGEVLSFLSFALVQSAVIVVVGGAAFGVDWGPPLAAAVLVAIWALVGTGAGVLCGTLFRTSDQATAVGPPLGIALGMLGGCMWPLEIVGSTMRTVGHVTPHAWAVDAWSTLVSKGGSLGDVAGDLGILVAFAAVMLAVASLRLRRSLAH